MAVSTIFNLLVAVACCYLTIVVCMRKQSEEFSVCGFIHSKLLFPHDLMAYYYILISHIDMESSSIIPYTTVLSLAAQSARYEQSMQSNLWSMAQEATKATALQQKAASSETMADESSTMAAENQREGEALELQGEELLTKGEADEALAATDQSMADELGVKSAEEEAAAVSEFGEAAGEEALVEQDFAEANAEAAMAARDGFEADTDEIVVGACEMVPFLDILCDIIGGRGRGRLYGCLGRSSRGRVPSGRGDGGASASRERWRGGGRIPSDSE
jgi:hypothetical protein